MSEKCSPICVQYLCPVIVHLICALVQVKDSQNNASAMVYSRRK